MCKETEQVRNEWQRIWLGILICSSFLFSWCTFSGPLQNFSGPLHTFSGLLHTCSGPLHNFSGPLLFYFDQIARFITKWTKLQVKLLGPLSLSPGVLRCRWCFGALSFWLVSSMSCGAFSWVRLLA